MVLTGRFQQVLANRSLSSSVPIKSGVPQGTVLGPLLFLVYINDLGTSAVQDCIVSCFADDTRLKRKIANESDVKTLQKAVDKSAEWSEENNMALHEQKFELLTHY